MRTGIDIRNIGKQRTGDEAVLRNSFSNDMISLSVKSEIFMKNFGIILCNSRLDRLSKTVIIDLAKTTRPVSFGSTAGF